MGLIILRCVFVLVAAGLAVSVIRSNMLPQDNLSLTSVFSLASSCLRCCHDRRGHPRPAKTDRDDLGRLLWPVGRPAYDDGPGVGVGAVDARRPRDSQKLLHHFIQLATGAVLCYVCISILMQTKNDFRFIIPYVEFAKEVKGLKPCILDTSVVIDGRIADVVETGVFDGQLIMPKFVISELQAVADSSDRLRRGRGRRGLDILNRLRGNKNIELVIHERDLPEFAGLSVDLKLVALAKSLQGKLITNDYNLNKVAKLQGVTVINLNDLANSLKPVFLPGERIEVRIVKVGEEPGQGIGYLEDGTMVVVESGRDRLNQTVPIAVTSVLQTSAGRMVFGKIEK